MEINGSTLIGDLLGEYPFLLEFLPRISPVFTRLRDPGMLDQMGGIATLEMVSQMGGIPLVDLIGALALEVERVTGTGSVGAASSRSAESEGKIDRLKSIIKDLHAGRTVEEVKGRFLSLATEVDAVEIARMEQELIDGGLPQEEIKKLCDVHVEVFKGSLDKGNLPEVPPGHPIHTFMLENQVLDALLSALSGIVDDIRKGGLESREADLKRSLDNLGQVDLHYLRKENQLFPLLEKHSVSGPSQVMWAIHDDIRKMVKMAWVLIEAGDADSTIGQLDLMIRAMRDMIYKEEKVLFPMSLEKLNDQEWKRVRRGEEEIGYSWIEPEEGFDAGNEEIEIGGGEIGLEEGSLTIEQLNGVLKNLPIDISFVDTEDRVAYYSATPDRIFPRSPAVIGREVRNCHPPKSVHVVQRILDEFRAGNRDVAEFWIDLHGRFVHIRYFAVRDGKGEYLGTLEVSQDVTGIRELKGEKRLLDWEGFNHQDNQ